jgi:hypothetical protein
MRFEKVWVEQCRVTKAIKRRVGAKSALDYLIGEKLMSFADAARDHPAFAKEPPKFLAAVWHTFNDTRLPVTSTAVNDQSETVFDSFCTYVNPGDPAADHARRVHLCILRRRTS